jgi:8-oxo-dGTP pyrophosphatase MutT (NUDIX family)
MQTSPSIAQAAAIPIDPISGRVCLVTSSSGKGWVIPKGHIEPGQSARATALHEAWEEAGLLGALDKDPVGSYLYEKNGASYRVLVFLMRVTEIASSWPEIHRRTRRWLPLDQTAQFVQVTGMRRILGRVNDLYLPSLGDRLSNPLARRNG